MERKTVVHHPRFIMLGLALNVSVLSCNSVPNTSTPTSERAAPVQAASSQKQEADSPCETDESARAFYSWLDESSRRVEAELDSWSPPCEDTYAPSRSALDPEIDIVGEWSTGSGLAVASLTFTPKDQSGSYIVCFKTGGCLDYWELQRLGEYSDGCLRLDRAVRQYLPLTYDRLYAVRIQGEERLLPSVCSDDIHYWLDHTEVMEDAAAVRSIMMFRRSEAWATPR